MATTKRARSRSVRKAAPKAEKRYRRDGSLESVGAWRGGKRVGAWKFWHHDGKTLKAKGRYDEDGLFTGAWTWYAADGKPRQAGRFEKGEQVGLWKRYFGGTTQLVDVGRYEAGKRVGAWKFYDKQGNLRRTQTFGARRANK